jgi:hypothetical protein
VRREALLRRLPDLACVDGISGNALFLDELLDLSHQLALLNTFPIIANVNGQSRTISSVFAALSLTKGLAIGGMRCEALMWPLWLLTRSSDILIQQRNVKRNERCCKGTSGGKSGVIEGRGWRLGHGDF